MSDLEQIKAENDAIKAAVSAVGELVEQIKAENDAIKAAVSSVGELAEKSVFALWEEIYMVRQQGKDNV